MGGCQLNFTVSHITCVTLPFTVNRAPLTLIFNAADCHWFHRIQRRAQLTAVPPLHQPRGLQRVPDGHLGSGQRHPGLRQVTFTLLDVFSLLQSSMFAPLLSRTPTSCLWLPAQQQEVSCLWFWSPGSASLAGNVKLKAPVYSSTYKENVDNRNLRWLLNGDGL